MCSFAGCVFLAGGKSEHDLSFASCEVYNTQSCEWAEVASMNTKRSSFSLTYFQNKVWAVGGVSNGKVLDKIETYDIGENRWTTIDKKLLQNRFAHSAVVHNKNFYVIGGFTKTCAISSIEVYSSETNQFSFVTPMNQARGYFGCSILNNKIYVIGGCYRLHEYTVWSEGPSLSLSLSYFACTSIE